MTDIGLRELLTIVVPTRDRAEFLERMIGYYDTQRTPWKLVIADSSTTNSRIAEPAAWGPGRNLDLIVRHYEPSVDFLEKLSDALAAVETPYTVLAADDDFLVTAGLERALRFLERHCDYAIASGVGATFSTKTGGVYGAVESVGRYEQRSIEHATASARLLDHLRNYSTTMYSVQRTEHMKDHVRRSSGRGLDYVFMELLPSCLSVVRGKAKKLPQLHMVRQRHAGATSTQDLLHRQPIEWLAQPSWATQYRVCQEVLAEMLERQDGLEPAKATQLVGEAFAAYTAKFLTSVTPREEPRRKPGFVSRVRETVAKVPAARRILYAHRSAHGQEHDVSLSALVHRWSPYHADFVQVHRAIIKKPPTPHE